ncbi:MAG: hypothetical protein UY48_C0042G0016 [Candidatus Gottesmanbacteria bacterium GW2011_GWB1_49_7]|uniref:Uncharacterized protein n=1 Tax=Candidatus Gottesmanbacteria bacterium GW2011_GWB1_49_7 TaxID=1618448 RepID=A0A0G1YVA1_9BACT|nr:MAG: hypothetical protein UY48_C0042G0016 [Candidatus Gottesmanbacteria bacterium GW2011_GWB1_49_7]
MATIGRWYLCPVGLLDAGVCKVTSVSGSVSTIELYTKDINGVTTTISSSLLSPMVSNPREMVRLVTHGDVLLPDLEYTRPEIACHDIN